MITKEPWKDLEAYLEQTLYFEDGNALNIAGFSIDTGGSYTNQVYSWVKEMKEKGKKCYGIKGYAGKPNIPLLYKRTVVQIKDEKTEKKS